MLVRLGAAAEDCTTGKRPLSRAHSRPANVPRLRCERRSKRSLPVAEIERASLALTGRSQFASSAPERDATPALTSGTTRCTSSRESAPLPRLDARRRHGATSPVTAHASHARISLLRGEVRFGVGAADSRVECGQKICRFDAAHGIHGRPRRARRRPAARAHPGAGQDGLGEDVSATVRFRR
jgi:hypothetical protein